MSDLVVTKIVIRFVRRTISIARYPPPWTVHDISVLRAETPLATSAFAVLVMYLAFVGIGAAVFSRVLGERI